MDGIEIVALYDRHARALTGFFARRTGDPQLALDLLSQTFMVVVERHDQCRATDAGGRAAWVYRIAATELAGHFRRAAGEQRMVSRLALERPLTADEVAAVQCLAALEEPGPLTRALFELPADQREALERRVLGEQPYDVISRGLGVSEPTARARVSRGLRALRRAAGGSDAG